MPEWIACLNHDHWLKKIYIEAIRECVVEVDKLRDVETVNAHFTTNEYIEKAYLSDVDATTGSITINLEAKENLYNYVIIDCRESTLSFVKNSILNSELSKFICLDNIDWEECHNNALSWVQKSVIEEKINNPSVKGVEIAKKYNLSVCTIYEWWRKFINERQKIFFAVYSPELNQTYTDFDKASKIAGVSAKAIRKCAHHPDKLKHAGKHPITGERLTWIGYTKNEYEKINLSIKGA